MLKQGDTIPSALPVGPSDNRNPSWSQNGKIIYFESNRTGDWLLYAWNIESKTIKQLNISDGRNPQESSDGNWILFSSTEGNHISRCAKVLCLDPKASNPVSQELVLNIDPQDAANWVPTSSGIYFIQRPKEAPPQLAFYDYNANQIRPVT